ncbi:hypothetical protein BC936DRAFT_148926 [Jimgerdemannia flammicorona]|uniref:Uncharacterized protein n=1 Tax=Jimgerdemannia flammicorona TaxID=994334 RepID=A0A433D202_9FUNG|nr:hypothetical protein BC936DRAFT_148926 [Jimgerdemannia flammicorona]
MSTAIHLALSNLSLSEIPREIGELQHVTVLSQDRISNCSLKLFLSANALTSICPELFHLQNLSVLRNNNLTNLPPEIGLLHNLVEFSIGNNQLQFLPSEILNLRKLNIIALTPNPFLLWETILSSLSTSIEDSNSHSGTRNEELTQSSPNLSPQLPPYRRIINSFSPPSLAEFASRRILADNVSYAKDELPEVLAMQLQQAERANICPNPRCRGRFVTAEVEELLWIRSLHNEIVPLLFRWCHIACRHSIEVSGLPNLSDLSRYMTMTCLGEPVILSVHG